MPRIEGSALVLRVVDFGESDRIVHLLTPTASRVTAIAKGARRSRKRFPGTLDLLNLLSVQIERRRARGLARLDQARLVDAFPALREQPSRFALACYVVELTARLAPEGSGGREARRLFDAVVGALRAIAERPADARLRLWLELRLLAALGLAPELRRCVRCGQTAQALAGFSVAEGGPLCRGCAMPRDALLAVTVGTLRALEQGLSLPLDRVGRLALGAQAQREAEQLVERFQRFHTGVELRSAPFLGQMLAARASA